MQNLAPTTRVARGRATTGAAELLRARGIMRRAIIESWIAAANAFDRRKYLGFFADDAVLEDPSVGRSFEGKAGIGGYFDAYFAGYRTQTRVVRISKRARHLHVEVHFTGDFPEGEIDGIFDVTFRGNKIASVRADLED